VANNLYILHVTDFLEYRNHNRNNNDLTGRVVRTAAGLVRETDLRTIPQLAEDSAVHRCNLNYPLSANRCTYTW